jgi:hypothetical protein
MKKYHLQDKITQEETNPNSDRKHCPDCCYYLDGVKMAHPESGAQMFSPCAGMRFVIWSTGDIYQRLGTMIPCLCEAGNKAASGYEKNAGFVHRTTKPIATYIGNKLRKSI